MELTEIVRCSFSDCEATFEDVVSMKRHKIQSEEHEYCRKCDQDFPDYEGHLAHRVESEKHITCEKCGQDFGSKSGLSRHKALSHPVDQDIVCKDCKQQFTRASAYVWHIESGRCSKNLHSHQQLEAQRQHKHILKQILNKPEDFNFRVESAPGPDIRGSDGEDDDYERAGTTGGVSLTSAFDDDDEQKKIAYEPLRPNLGDLIAFESKPQWPTPFEAGGPSERKDPVAKAIEYNQNWEAALANKDRSYQEDNAANLMHSHNARIYNPESQSYDPYRFWDAQLQAFRCPYAECDLQADQNFDSAADIKEHMVQAHTVTRIRCPSCLKHFGSSAALIAHAETAVSSCGLKNGRNFGQIIDELSGGFLALKTEDGENKTPMFEATKPSGGW